MDEVTLPVRSRQQVCLYCTRPGDTDDHVPPKVLLERPYPLNLRTVPACRACNGGWSLDEEYVATFLALVGATPRLQAKVTDGGKVDRSLVGAPRFDDRIISALTVTADGRVAINPEMNRIATVMAKIAMGLHALKYGRGPTLRAFSCLAVCGLEGELPPKLRDALFDRRRVKPKRWTIVQAEVFSFVFVKPPKDGAPLWCVINLHQTLIVVVECPAPITRKRGQLGSLPW